MDRFEIRDQYIIISDRGCLTTDFHTGERIS